MTKSPPEARPSAAEPDPPDAERDALARDLREIAARCAALPSLDDRPEEDILGTRDLGLSGRFVYSRPGELEIIHPGDPDAEPIDFSPLPRGSVRRPISED